MINYTTIQEIRVINVYNRIMSELDLCFDSLEEAKEHILNNAQSGKPINFKKVMQEIKIIDNRTSVLLPRLHRLHKNYLDLFQRHYENNKDYYKDIPLSSFNFEINQVCKQLIDYWNFFHKKN